MRLAGSLIDAEVSGSAFCFLQDMCFIRILNKLFNLI